MKLTFKSEELIRVLRDLMRIVPTATKRQDLKHILIRANRDDDRVDIYASSEDMSGRRTLFQLVMNTPVVIEESGACLVPAKELSEIVKSANETEITMYTDRMVTRVVFGEWKFGLASLDPALFTPYEHQSGDATIVVVRAPDLNRLLRRTSYAALRGEANVLSGVQLSVVDGELHGLATDKQRLATHSIVCQSVIGDERAITIPAEQLDKLATALPAHDDDEEVTLSIGRASLVATWKEQEVQMAMRALEGVFPDTSTIIAAPFPNRVIVDRQALLNACERVSILSEVEFQRARVSFGSDRIVWSSKSTQYGEARGALEIISTTVANELSMTCNIKHWITMLRAYEGVEQVEIGLGHNNSAPAKISPVGEPGLCLNSWVKDSVNTAEQRTAS